MSARKPEQDGQDNSARQADVFRDLCRRNERRARLARRRKEDEAQREPRSESDRVGQSHRRLLVNARPVAVEREAPNGGRGR
jgi:hypothetical protein